MPAVFVGATRRRKTQRQGQCADQGHPAGAHRAGRVEVGDKTPAHGQARRKVARRLPALVAVARHGFVVPEQGVSRVVAQEEREVEATPAHAHRRAQVEVARLVAHEPLHHHLTRSPRQRARRHGGNAGRLAGRRNHRQRVRAQGQRTVVEQQFVTQAQVMRQAQHCAVDHRQVVEAQRAVAAEGLAGSRARENQLAAVACRQGAVVDEARGHRERAVEGEAGARLDGHRLDAKALASAQRRHIGCRSRDHGVLRSVGHTAYPVGRVAEVGVLTARPATRSQRRLAGEIEHKVTPHRAEARYVDVIVGAYLRAENHLRLQTT